MSIKTLSGIVIKGLCLLAILMPVCAQSTTANTLQHPRDQIALQLGAIQMGYTVPFTLIGNISTPKMQQAVNALVMGRNSLNATVGAPAVQVQGAVDCPNVDTVEYRDQLYSAVEYVVTTPVVATIKGSATLANSKKVTVGATKLTVPPSAWTIPVPYSLEARSSADVEALRDELVAAGVLIEQGNGGGSGGIVTANMVTVQGGTLPSSSQLAGQTVATFQIGKYEVTWGEWKEIRAWAVANGYTDLANVGSGSGDDHPVREVSWYDVVKWCNARSEKEGKTAVYLVSGAVYRSGEYGFYGSGVVTQKAGANGYRLPSEAEWEWAARGGVSSKGYTYSGSNDLNAIAWTWGNSSNETKAVGTKAGNELGIYDMTGNVWEWCWDVYDLYASYRRIRGGGLRSNFEDANVSFNGYEPNPASRAYSDGFRLARRSGN